MNSHEQFILELLKEGRAYLALILPAFLAWLVPSPKYGKPTDSK